MQEANTSHQVFSVIAQVSRNCISQSIQVGCHEMARSCTGTGTRHMPQNVSNLGRCPAVGSRSHSTLSKPAITALPLSLPRLAAASPAHLESRRPHRRRLPPTSAASSSQPQSLSHTAIMQPTLPQMVRPPPRSPKLPLGHLRSPASAGPLRPQV